MPRTTAAVPGLDARAAGCGRSWARLGAASGLPAAGPEIGPTGVAFAPSHVWFACFSGSHLPGDQAVGLAHRAVAAGPELVLVTEGPRGALLRTADGEVCRVPARRFQPVDTLGAGDAVIGGVLARLMLGDTPEAALRAGRDLAAASCGHYGAFGYGEDLDGRWAAATA